ncbi:glycosyl transferase [Paenibacillus sp. CAA11]|uniref:glycosyltransferase family 2 protein n=1 Tax=Paenibacillus sp. CAA11 TaxID=1532905 RepID=UPI000D3D4303|nr:glycosyltransferase [Paenibacillus sp. CAA11]AWB45819.1 glycosyl transferase [Paenibacillus sp. CAA11]
MRKRSRLRRRPHRHRKRRNPSSSKPRYHNHPHPIVSVIIPAMNESRTIQGAVAEAFAVHPCSEVIVVANGCTDATAALAKAMGARVLEFEAPLGHDVPRRYGAEAAKGDILLFTDGDMVIPAEDLRPYVSAVFHGVDVALNGYPGPRKQRPVHPVVLAKHVLNVMLARPDLGGASLTAVPHALSWRAARAIGLDALGTPPLAQAAAVMLGLDIKAVHTVAVGRMNRKRRRPGSGDDPLTALVAGDHLEAVGLLTDSLGSRGGFPDLNRLRDKLR